MALGPTQTMDFTGMAIRATEFQDANGVVIAGADALNGTLGATSPDTAVVTTLSVTTSSTHEGAAIFNEAGAAVDFRVESDGNANAIKVDGTNNRVGIFTASPTVPLDVTGAAKISGALTATGGVDGVLGGVTPAAATVTTLTATTVANTAINVPLVLRQTADVTKDDGAAASTLTGLAAAVAIGTYKYKAHIQCLATANGGAKVTMLLTTAVLTSIQNDAKAFTASGVACARSTTATSGATLYGATAAITQIELEGTLIVSTAGTLTLQGEQNASHADETVFYAGSYLELVRIS